MPIRGEGNEYVTNHVWKRFKIGTKGTWSYPFRINDVIEDVEVVEIAGVRPGVNSFRMDMTKESGVVISTNPFSIPSIESTEWLVDIIENSLTGVAPIVITGGVISHSNTDGNKHIPIGGSAGQVLSTDGSGGYTWVTDSVLDGYTKLELNTSGAGGLVHWDNVTGKDTVYYDATVGNSAVGGLDGDYLTVKSALNAGHHALKVIGDTTETIDWGSHSKDIILDAD
ncbi:hypothetical protein KAU11_10445, partial [Candidatus Babeliales bacterium]|nr:hypothetical protein [Candidatus Babeliales bacterium]